MLDIIRELNVQEEIIAADELNKLKRINNKYTGTQHKKINKPIENAFHQVKCQ